MNSSLFDLEPATDFALPRPEQEGPPAKSSELRQLRPGSSPPGLRVELAVRGTRSPSPEWSKLVGSLLERTLQRLLGPEAPQELLLESALFEGLSSWPPRGDQTLTLWSQRVAVGVAFGYLKSTDSSPQIAASAPSGSLREALTHLYRWLRAARQHEQLAFALLELNANSVAEASAILRVAPAVVRQRAAFLRRQLLFAARGDRLLARYLRLGRRMHGLLRHWDYAVQAAPPSQRARRISAEVQLELRWFM